MKYLILLCLFLTFCDRDPQSSYNICFEVLDQNSNPIENARIDFIGCYEISSKTDSSGIVHFYDANDCSRGLHYNYKVFIDGVFITQGDGDNSVYSNSSCETIETNY